MLKCMKGLMDYPSFQLLDVVENRSINCSQKLEPKYKLPQVNSDAFFSSKLRKIWKLTLNCPKLILLQMLCIVYVQTAC